MSTASQSAAERYLNRGLAVIPVPAGSKNPNRRGWESERLTLADVPEAWANGANVGLLTGSPSGGLVDIDLDVPEAVKVAGRFLPDTLASGRQSAPCSHRWYISPGAASATFKDTDGTVLLELRADGRQTLVSPSTHPDGERCFWHEGIAEPLELEAADQARAGRELVTAVLLARHVPRTGRHDHALALAGFLLRNGRLDAETVSRVLHAAWHAAGADTDDAVRDLDGIVRDTAANLASDMPVMGGPTIEATAPGTVKLLSKWWGWHNDPDAGEDADDAKAPKQSELLLGYAESAELFHSPDGTGYATIAVAEHRENHAIRGRNFRRWLLRRYYAETGNSPSAQAVTDALGVVEAQSLFAGPERPVHLRVAGYEGAVYLDLANEGWEAVEITATSWRVASSDELPVRFLRRENAASLPYPASTGSLEPLRGLLNVGSEEDWRLMVGWLVGALQPDGPYPVLDLEGEQGSAKSTTARVLRSVIDPAVEPLRAPPREARDLAIAAMGNHAVTLDNLSGIRPWLSDALCRLATGGGFATRSLYTDDEEVIFSAKRPVILTGIDSIATAGDLRDRAIIMQLPAIPAGERRTERAFLADLDTIRPTALAGLLDAVSAALRNLDSVRLPELPRMSDFAVWVTAAEQSLPWEPGAFMEAYSGNRQTVEESALDTDPVASAVRSLMRDRSYYEGTASQLMAELSTLTGDDIRRGRGWPGSPRYLADRLKRLAPALRTVAIEYGEGKSGHNRRRVKTLTKIEADSQRMQRPQTDDYLYLSEKPADASADAMRTLSPDADATDPATHNDADVKTGRGRYADASPEPSRPHESPVDKPNSPDADAENAKKHHRNISEEEDSDGWTEVF